MVGRKRSSQELRALWKKSIMEQILLIRMDKENKTLDGKMLSKFHHVFSPCFLVFPSCAHFFFSFATFVHPTFPSLST